MELVGHRLHPGHLVVGQLHEAVDLLLEAGHAPGAPLQPELEDVVVSSALDDLVAGVVAAVVALVRLEEVVGGHLVAADEEALGAGMLVFSLQAKLNSLKPKKRLLLKPFWQFEGKNAYQNNKKETYYLLSSEILGYICI